MGNKPQAGKPVSQDEILNTIGELKQGLTQLEKREEHLEAKCNIALQDALAKKKANDKKGAIFSLKKKKMLDAEIEKLAGAKLNLEQQIFQIEGATTNKAMFDALNAANNLQTRLQGLMSIDAVDKLMDEIAENQARQEEISEALSRNTQFMDELDEDELMDELDQLEAMELEGELLDKDELLLRELETPEEREERLKAKESGLPSVPASKPRTEEEELEALAAELELA